MDGERCINIHCRYQLRISRCLFNTLAVSRTKRKATRNSISEPVTREKVCSDDVLEVVQDSHEWFQLEQVI